MQLIGKPYQNQIRSRYTLSQMKNHFPLALGVLYSALVAYKNGALLYRFQLIPLNYLAPQALFNGRYAD
jgi:hypothetical protein